MKALLLIPLLFSSCTYADKDRAIAMGGRGVYKGSSFGLVWDNEGSFRDAALLAGVAVGAWQSVAASKASEATARAVSNNATKEAIAKSADATKVELGAQEVTKATTLPK